MKLIKELIFFQHTRASIHVSTCKKNHKHINSSEGFVHTAHHAWWAAKSRASLFKRCSPSTIPSLSTLDLVCIIYFFVAKSELWAAVLPPNKDFKKETACYLPAAVSSSQNSFLDMRFFSWDVSYFHSWVIKFYSVLGNLKLETWAFRNCLSIFEVRWPFRMRPLLCPKTFVGAADWKRSKL